jgi:hypothetical protein
MIDCKDSNRIWAACVNAAKRYKGSLEKQFLLIDNRDLTFVQLEREIRTARRHFGLAKSAVINHHRVHRCADLSSLNSAL